MPVIMMILSMRMIECGWDIRKILKSFMDSVLQSSGKNGIFSFFFQGTARSSLLIGDIHPFGTARYKNLFKYIADDHWSIDNPNPNAKYPRLTQMENKKQHLWI